MTTTELSKQEKGIIRKALIMYKRNAEVLLTAKHLDEYKKLKKQIEEISNKLV